MVFRSLELNNIGLYKGKNLFDLEPKNGNVILFGGKNGSGKTTILEAVKICLYGNKSLGFSKSEYEKFIKKFINKDTDEGYISLEFVFITEEGKDVYKIKRQWHIKDKFKEEFYLYKNNELFKDIPQEYWQDFISDILPQGLVDFFFFDGEKIEKLAEDLTEVEFINDIKNLIGITLIDDLHNTLGIIEKKNLKERSITPSFIKKIEELEQKKEEKEKELTNHIQDKAQINLKLSSLNKELKTVEKEIYQKGGNLFKDYENLKIKRDFLIKEIEDIKFKIKELSSSELPLAIGLNLVEELVNQLDIEDRIKNVEFEKKLLEEKYKIVMEILNSVNIPDNVKFALEKVFNVQHNIDGKIIHNLSEKEVENIKLTLKNLKEMIIPHVKELFSKLEKKEEELLQVSLSLENVPKEEVLEPYIKRIKEIEEKITQLKIEEKIIEEKIKQLETEKKTIEKEKEKLEKVLETHVKQDRVIELIRKTKKVLERFKEEFINRKVAILKREILEALYKLERKENFIADLDIDNKTFSITLYDKFHRVIPLDRLSAGERQIFAISFLWGLAKASGKSIPVIIDTPLSRLDKDHKENFVKNYYPNISHQVIILSTDTEIDEHLYKLLKPFISHAYTLEYTDECMCTKIKEGYFFD